MIASAIAWLSSGDVDASLYHAEQSLRLTEGLIAPARVRATGNLASLFGDLGELVRSRRMHERCLELATALGAHRDIRWSSAELAIDRYFAGEWDDATTALDAYLGDSIAEPYMMDASGFATRARMRAARGDAELAMADVSACVASGRRVRGGQSFCFAVSFGPRFSAESDPAAAAEMLDEVLSSIEGEPWIWSPACLVDLAYALRALHREHEFADSTAAAYPTKWLAAARAIAAGEFVEAAHVFDDIGARPDAALARLHAAKQLVAAGETSAAAGHLDEALAFWRSVEATAYIDAAEALLEATHRR